MKSNCRFALHLLCVLGTRIRFSQRKISDFLLAFVGFFFNFLKLIDQSGGHMTQAEPKKNVALEYTSLLLTLCSSNCNSSYSSLPKAEF